jgi:hypothetical protein
MCVYLFEWLFDHIVGETSAVVANAVIVPTGVMIS